MYTIEMARAHMRELQELADRSRRHRVARAAAGSRGRSAGRGRTR